MHRKPKSKLSQEDREALFRFRDSENYAPVIKLLETIGEKQQEDMMRVPIQNGEEILRYRTLLAGSERALELFKSEIDKCNPAR